MTRPQAEQAAYKLLRRMKGGNWRVRVWENVGWNYCVETEHLSVCPPSEWGDDKKFSCFLKPHYTLFGDNGVSTNPNIAVRVTLQRAMMNMLEYSSIVAKAVDESN